MTCEQISGILEDSGKIDRMKGDRGSGESSSCLQNQLVCICSVKKSPKAGAVLIKYLQTQSIDVSLAAPLLTLPTQRSRDHLPNPHPQLLLPPPFLRRGWCGGGSLSRLRPHQPVLADTSCSNHSR